MRAALLCCVLLLCSHSATAQIDAIIDAVVGAVEATPVYDTGLREATENLASKIDRLNNVLFGGAEQTSAAYRNGTMYSNLYDLTTTFTTFVDRSYSKAKRLEQLYTDADGGTLSDNAAKVQQTRYVYDKNIFPKSRYGTLSCAPGSTARIGYTMDKISVSRDQVLKVYFYEQGGQRELVLSIGHDDINKAKAR